MMTYDLNIFFFFIQSPFISLNKTVVIKTMISDKTVFHFQHCDTGTCFIQTIYAPSSSLLQGKHIPFSPSPLRLNIFRLFLILSLTQLCRYTPDIFLFSTATFKYKYRAPSDELDKNIQRKPHFLFVIVYVHHFIYF